MDPSAINRLNYYNIIAMLLASCLAIIIPFELVALSYAILGPAHYLTEISWLKKRWFFTLKRYDFLPIAGVIVISLLLKIGNARLVYYTFGLSFILMITESSIKRLSAFVILIGSAYFLLSNNMIVTVFGLYVPTLVHVYIFTGTFILSGALKDRVASGYIAFIIFLLCPLILMISFRSFHNMPSAWAIASYSGFSRLNAITLHKPFINVFTSQASVILTRFIAFAYTYHYINWFSKTRVINWHRISVAGVIVIGLIWVASVALYFYNYATGFKWLFLLSLVHVILEFPLNQRSFIGIGKQLRSRFVAAD